MNSHNYPPLNEITNYLKINIIRPNRPVNKPIQKNTVSLIIFEDTIVIQVDSSNESEGVDLYILCKGCKVQDSKDQKKLEVNVNIAAINMMCIHFGLVSLPNTFV
ncbi:MAG: hypothetical protein KAV97_03960 [Actinomycetia bacterium]|nr:hypothetical protein [Actinomycetes bacterium]